MNEPRTNYRLDAEAEEQRNARRSAAACSVAKRCRHGRLIASGCHECNGLPSDMEKTAILYRGDVIVAQYSNSNRGWITRDGFLATPPAVEMWWSLSRDSGIRPPNDQIH